MTAIVAEREAAGSAVAERLNRTCACVTLDRSALGEALAAAVDDPGFSEAFVLPRPHLFSNVPVFVSPQALADMQRVVHAIEAAARLPGYRKEVLGAAPEISRPDHGPAGAFMGYDFHLDPAGPRLIEVNTNAGGAFLNAILARAQRACCAEVEPWFQLGGDDGFEASVVAMFRREFVLQRGADAALTRIAIVDDAPQEQYLYPEFLLAQRVLMRAGLEAIVADPSALDYRDGGLVADGKGVDLVYNRLVDFAFEEPRHAALAAAYRDGAVVVTPNPHHHALLANKRNLALLSDRARLAAWGLGAGHLEALAGVPETRLVTPETADMFWSTRKAWFFKPLAGHGGKAVYRGDKLTKAVWTEIAKGSYVAQAYAAPGERVVELDGSSVARKMDMRLFTYQGRILLPAARLYQGQTTNFRTPGGGFSPVLLV
jgi:hypothetical protein